MENWKRFLNEGFPQPDPDYLKDYEYNRRSGRTDSGPRFSLVQDPQYKEARKIYLSEPLQKARKSYMVLPYGDPREEKERKDLLAAIQQAVKGNKDLFAQVVAQMEDEESRAR